MVSKGEIFDNSEGIGSSESDVGWTYEKLDKIGNEMSKLYQRFKECSSGERNFLLALFFLHLIEVVYFYIANIFSPGALAFLILVFLLAFYAASSDFVHIFYCEYVLLMITALPLFCDRVPWIIDLESNLTTSLIALLGSLKDCSFDKITSLTILISQAALLGIVALIRYLHLTEPSKILE